MKTKKKTTKNKNKIKKKKHQSSNVIKAVEILSCE